MDLVGEPCGLGHLDAEILLDAQRVPGTRASAQDYQARAQVGILGDEVLEYRRILLAELLGCPVPQVERVAQDVLDLVRHQERLELGSAPDGFPVRRDGVVDLLGRALGQRQNLR
jgi:hypothetical protein